MLGGRLRCWISNWYLPRILSALRLMSFALPVPNCRSKRDALASGPTLPALAQPASNTNPSHRNLRSDMGGTFRSELRSGPSVGPLRYDCVPGNCLLRCSWAAHAAEAVDRYAHGGELTGRHGHHEERAGWQFAKP